MTAWPRSSAQSSRPMSGRRPVTGASATSAPIRTSPVERQINTSDATREIRTSDATREIRTSDATREIRTSRAMPPVRGAPGRPSPRQTQRGSASLIGLALCAFVVIAALVTADIGALAVARARAETAADLAALAAVTPHLAASGPSAPDNSSGLGSPAERAHLVATSNGAEVIACSCDPVDSTVTVRVHAHLIPFGATVAVRGSARAVLPMDPSPAASAHEPSPRGDNRWRMEDGKPMPRQERP